VMRSSHGRGVGGVGVSLGTWLLLKEELVKLK
jgi:hypothetical protein